MGDWSVLSAEARRRAELTLIALAPRCEAWGADERDFVAHRTVTRLHGKP
jgi:hypothetical protein